MNQIHAILELGKDGYGVWFEELPHIFAFGDTVENAKTDAKFALEGYIVALSKCNQPIPEILKDEYELVYQFDVEALLKHIDGTVTKVAGKLRAHKIKKASQYSCKALISKYREAGLNRRPHDYESCALTG